MELLESAVRKEKCTYIDRMSYGSIEYLTKIVCKMVDNRFANGARAIFRYKTKKK